MPHFTAACRSDCSNCSGPAEAHHKSHECSNSSECGDGDVNIEVNVKVNVNVNISLAFCGSARARALALVVNFVRKRVALDRRKCCGLLPPVGDACNISLPGQEFARLPG